MEGEMGLCERRYGSGRKIGGRAVEAG